MSPPRLPLFVALAASLAVGSVHAEVPENSDRHLSDLPVGTIVTVHMSRERVAIGVVDERTDERHLWIRGETTHALVRGGLPWSEIISIVPGTKPDTTRITGESHLSVRPEPIPHLGEWNNGRTRTDGEAPWLSPSGFSEPRTARSSHTVTTLQIAATVANWDRDAAVDGLQVRVVPLDQFRRVVPVKGSVSFELVGQHRPSSGSRTAKHRNAFPILEQWTVRLEPDDYGEWGAVVELPFRRFHPQADLDIAPEGLLHARLSVPGQGVYEATDDWLLLRPPSRIRDDHQLVNGVRSFPGERHPRSH